MYRAYADVISLDWLIFQSYSDLLLPAPLVLLLHMLALLAVHALAGGAAAAGA